MLDCFAPLAMTAPCGRTPCKLPPFVPGLRVGLFGGSFNPPHDGHREASLLALRRLQLHRVWWLVSPGNPLKDARELAPLDKTYAIELAFTYDALNRFSEAEWLFAEALALDPRSTSTKRYYQAHLESWKNGGLPAP